MKETEEKVISTVDARRIEAGMTIRALAKKSMEETRTGTVGTTGEHAEVTVQRDKNEYLQRIRELSLEDQAFMDGYLFAKVTERQKKGA